MKRISGGSTLKDFTAWSCKVFNSLTYGYSILKFARDHKLKFDLKTLNRR